MKKYKNISETGNKILNAINPDSSRVFRISLILLFSISFINSYWFRAGIFIYQENKSLFIFSGEYLQKFTAKPGGLLTYAANFLTQGFFSPLYGSLLFSILLILICLASSAIVKRLSVSNSHRLIIILLPSVMLLLLQSRYDYSIQQTLGFLVVAGWFLISAFSVNKYFRSAVIFLFPLFYYIAGSFAFIYLGMYLTFNLLYEKKRNKYLLPLTLAVIAGLTIILAKEVVFLQPLNHILGYPLFFADTTRLSVYLVTLGILFVAFPLIIKLPYIFTGNRLTRVIELTTPLILFAVSVIIISGQYNPILENVMKVEEHIYDRDWDAVISQHEKSPSPNIIGQYYYNLALSEKGQLGQRMFAAPQSYGPMSLTLPRGGEHTYRALYFYYTIGLINEARHLAFELMVRNGYTPENLKMLIKTELLNGNYKIAERYINVLKKTLHYKSRAEKYEKMLNNPQLVNSDPELGEKIRLLPTEDFFILTDDSKNIDLLLKDNPGNKKAFEYKMARFMLEKDLIAVAEEVKNMKSKGYTYIPRHIDEAIVAYRNYSNAKPDLGGLSSDPDTEKRFAGYAQLINKYNGNRSLIEKNIGKRERNTFWYYLQFGTISGNFMRSNPIDRSIY